MLGKLLKRYSNFLLLLLLFFFTFSFFYHSDFSFNQDLGMHLKLGELIWQTHHVPTTNLFSYTNADFPFINHHWLFEVFAYFLNVFLGLQSLMIVKISVLLLCAIIVLLLISKTKSAIFFPIAFIFFHLLRERTDMRPEIFSFLFTLCILYLLERFEKKQDTWIFLIPFIELLWSNSHIYFPVGIFVLMIFLGDVCFERFVRKNKSKEIKNKLKTLFLVTILSILATLLNPNLLKGALYPFTVFNNYGVTITENQTIFTLQKIHFVNQDFLFFYLSGFLVFASIYVSFWRTKFSLKNMLLPLLGFGLAFQSIRGFPYLVLLSLPTVLVNINIQRMTWWIKTMNVVAIFLLIGESFCYLTGFYYKHTYQPFTPSLTLVQDEKPAADFLLQHHLPQPIFNNFGTGSYLIYRTYPQYKVFIDERPEAYPATFFAQKYVPMQESYDEFKHDTKKFNFQTIIFSITDQNPRALTFLNAITKDPEWKIVFLDQFTIIFTKTTIQQHLALPVVDLDKLHISDYKYTNDVAYTNLSTFLFNLHYFETARIFNQKALAINPDSLAANKAMAYILYFEKSNYAEIAPYYGKATNWVFW